MVRVEIDGTTVRFFQKRRDAIAAANVRTTQADQQHAALWVGVRSSDGTPSTHGWLVRNQVTKKLFDIDGQIPDAAAKDIFIV